MSGPLSSDDFRQIQRELGEIGDSLPNLGELHSAKRHIDNALDDIQHFIDYLEAP